MSMPVELQSTLPFDLPDFSNMPLKQAEPPGLHPALEEQEEDHTVGKLLESHNTLELSCNLGLNIISDQYDVSNTILHL